MNDKMEMIRSCLRDYHVDANLLVEFDGEETPDELKYATITQVQKMCQPKINCSSDLVGLVKAAVEWQGYPLMYIVDGSSSPDDNEVAHLRNILAMRGDAPYMGVVSRDNLHVHHIELGNRKIREPISNLDESSLSKETLLSHLIHNQSNQRAIGDRIVNLIHKLTAESISELTKYGNASEKDAKSLVVHSLLVRFLADRKLLPTELFEQTEPGSIGLEDSERNPFPYYLKLPDSAHMDQRMLPEPSYLFADNEKTGFTLKWIDARFNGNIPPVSDSVVSNLSVDAIRVLGGIVKKAPDDLEFLDWEIGWQSLDFAHIPTDVFCRVFESLQKELLKEQVHKHNKFQTPEFLANLMVKVSIESVKSQFDVKDIKILDPLAGTGTFLVAAFRELAAHHWLADGRRPDTKILKSILERQITGFETDASSLELAMVGLCMMQIELDPEPAWSSEFKLKKIRKSVLHLHENCDIESDFMAKHRNKYHIVIGNPLEKTNYHRSVRPSAEMQVNRILQCRGIENPRLYFPSSSIDLAWIWNSSVFAREDGAIALILQSKWLFNQLTSISEQRMAILDAIEVISIANCSSTTSNSRIEIPFCVLFARNRIPQENFPFRFFNSKIAKFPNNSKIFQLDASSESMLPVDTVRNFPQVLKLHAIGSIEDKSILERIKFKSRISHNRTNLNSQGKRYEGTLGSQSGIFSSGVGYTPLNANERGTSLETENRMEEVRMGEVEIGRSNFSELLVNGHELVPFSFESVKRFGKQEIYKGPMLVVDSKRPFNTARINACVCNRNAFYSKEIYGYSFFGSKEGELLSRYLCLILRSKVALWQMLFLSGKFGMESNSRFEKFELDNLFIPDFASYSKKQKKDIGDFFDRVNSNSGNFEEVDDWSFKLYGLGETDRIVISETLNRLLRRNDSKKLMKVAPTKDEIGDFCSKLSFLLKPFAERYQLEFSANRLDFGSKFPWECINVCFHNGGGPTSPNEEDMRNFWQCANSTLSDEFVNTYNKNSLLVGKLAENRLWSTTHAELLANRVVWSNLGIFKEDRSSGNQI